MKWAISGFGIVVLFWSSVAAQAPASKPVFDAASVRARAHTNNPNPIMTGGVLRGGRYDLKNATMLQLITVAYGVDPSTVIGGPNWLERNRFDIAAKAPTGTSPATLPVMLRSLLADRFSLVLHTGTEPIPSGVLRVGGTTRMSASTAVEPGGCQPVQAPPQNTAGAAPVYAISCRGVTMEAFAQQLRTFNGGYVNDPVVDLTGLRGNWDVDLKFTVRSNLGQAGPDGTTLFAALDQQLGLKLTLETVPTPVIVVDSVSDQPTADSADAARDLPDGPPAEFDVADIKVSPPDITPRGQLVPTGRLDFQGFTLKRLVQLAWGISDPELLAGGPKWFDSTTYTIVAKVTPGVSGNPEGHVFDIDDVYLMMRSLLTERFKLQTHVEDRPVSAYTLVVADTPKLAPADPSKRAKCLNGPAVGAKDPRDTNPALNQFFTCQDMTMAQFAEDLSRLGSGYFKEPVVDATGLNGAYDFTLSFTSLARLQTLTGRGSDAGASGTLGASDPSGALSLFDALQKQLGLKLELRKRPLPVLVIDRVEEQPTDN